MYRAESPCPRAWVSFRLSQDLYHDPLQGIDKIVCHPFRSDFQQPVLRTGITGRDRLVMDLLQELDSPGSKRRNSGDIAADGNLHIAFQSRRRYADCRNLDTCSRTGDGTVITVLMRNK